MKIIRDMHSQIWLYWNLLKSEVYSFTSNFDFEQTIDWIHKNKIVVATIQKADLHHTVKSNREKHNDFW